MLVKAQDFTSAEASGFDHLLNAGITNADEREFGRHKEGITRDQKDYGEYAHEHVANHAARL